MSLVKPYVVFTVLPLPQSQSLHLLILLLFLSWNLYSKSMYNTTCVKGTKYDSDVSILSPLAVFYFLFSYENKAMNV